MKFQAEHSSKLEELHRTQVFSQQIRGIIITIDEVDFCQAAVVRVLPLPNNSR